MLLLSSIHLPLHPTDQTEQLVNSRLEVALLYVVEIH